MTGLESFGLHLAARRRALGWTQKKLAAETHCAPITIRKIESGKSRPSAELASLLAQALNIAPNEQVTFVQWARSGSYVASPSGNPAHNLPPLLTRFVGRSTVSLQVQGWLRPAPAHGAAHDPVRLGTVLGPGGIGKTRLAIEAGRALLDDFPGGVWLIDLASAQDASLVPSLIVETLHVLVNPNQPQLQALATHLRDKKMLLLLDNCEHVIDVTAHLAKELLYAAPELRILATSREPLGIVGERLLDLAPLATPDLRTLERHANPAEYALEFDAVQFFVERAREVQSEFRVTAQSAPLIARIVTQLDGLPLAIQLAAARLRALSLTQIAGRLDDRFGLLTVGSRTVAPRHQTLTALIDWSYDLLSQAEQTLLRRLAVFVGGFDLESAHAVCASPDLHADILKLLTLLVDKSLVVLAPDIQGTRYRLLDTIRQYALARLREHDELVTFSRRHLDFFLHLAEQSELKLRGPEQAYWLNHLYGERYNFLSALDWSLRHGYVEQTLRLATGLWRYWSWRDDFAEGLGWLETALAQAPDAAPALRAAALTAAGALLNTRDSHHGTALLEQSLVLWRQAGDPRGIAMVLNSLGAAVSGTDPELAEKYLDESLTLRRALQDRWGIAYLLNNLGEIARSRGDLDRAYALYSESLELRQLLGDQRGIAVAMHNLGHTLLATGRLDRARELFRESMLRFQGLENQRGITECLVGIASLELAEAHYERATVLASAAQAWLVTTGATLMPADETQFQNALAECRARTTSREFARASATGQSLSLLQAARYALDAVLP